MSRGRNRHWHSSRDDLEPAIIQEFKDEGCLPLKLSSTAGSGIPDLLVGIQGNWTLVEVKTGNRPLRKEQVVVRAMCELAGLPWFLADDIDDVTTIIHAMEDRY